MQALVSSRRRERRLALLIGVVAALTVFAGFAPTYYLRTLFQTTSLAPLLHLHGLLFTGWVGLLLVQMLLVSSGKVALHRRLGVAGAALAALAIVVGFLAAVDAARRGVTAPNGPPPLVFLAIPMADLVVFGVLVSAALWFRARRDWHKRLMIMATLGILTPAIARLPFVFGAGPLVFFGLTDLLIVAAVVLDRGTIGRVHPAFALGGLFVILSQPLRLLVASTATWMSFARWLTST